GCAGTCSASARSSSAARRAGGGSTRRTARTARTDGRLRAVPEPAQPLSLTWIGHSTVLLEAAGQRPPTDPLPRAAARHLRRVAPPAAPPEGELDAVLISHVHYDHLDLASLRSLRAKRFVVPRGAGRVLGRKGLGPVIELGEDDELPLGGLTVRATHAAHPA